MNIVSIFQEKKVISQIKMRADRLGIQDKRIQFASVTNAADIAQLQ